MYWSKWANIGIVKAVTWPTMNKVTRILAGHRGQEARTESVRPIAKHKSQDDGSLAQSTGANCQASGFPGALHSAWAMGSIVSGGNGSVENPKALGLDLLDWYDASKRICRGVMQA